MAFNLQGALDEGYTYAEIARHLAEKRGFDYAGASSEGYSDEEIVNHLSSVRTVEEPTTSFVKPVPEEEPEKEEGGFFDMAKSIFSPAGRGGGRTVEIARGGAGGITSSSAGALGGIADWIGGLSDFFGPQQGYYPDEGPLGNERTGAQPLGNLGSARETVRPFVEEMRDIQSLERAVSEEFAPEGGVGRVAYDATVAAGQMAPMIAAFMITKNPNLALGTMGAQVGGQTWSEKKAEGWTDWEAGLEAGKQVAYEVGPEKIFGVFQRMGGVKLIRDVLELGVAEAGSEGVTELMNIFEESIRTGDVGNIEDFDFGKFAENLASASSRDRVNYAMLLGGILGVAMGGPGAVTTYMANQERMDVEEQQNVGQYVRENMIRGIREDAQLGLPEDPREYAFQNVGSEIVNVTSQVREAKARQSARAAEAAAEIARLLAAEQDATDFEFGGSLGTTGLQGPAGLAPAEISGIEQATQAPVRPAAPITPPTPTGQQEIELLGRQRQPGERRDPQNVPPVGQAMVDEVFDLDQYSASELADFAREQINSRPVQVPGLGQRAIDEINLMEEQGDIEGLQQIVRRNLDKTDLRGRVAERTRVTPANPFKSESKPPNVQPKMEMLEPGAAPEITDTGREMARRFPINSVRDKSGQKAFELISIEQNGDVHVKYTAPATKAFKSEVSGDRGYMYATWNIDDPGGTLRAYEMAGLRKNTVPKDWKEKVTETAREQLMGYGRRTSQKFKGRVTAKVPFAGAPTLGLHIQQLMAQRVREAEQLSSNNRIDLETRKSIEAAAEEEARKTQDRNVERLKNDLANEGSEAVEWRGVPVHKKDAGSTIRTVISRAALNRITKGTAQHERAYQILPDGSTRILEIVPTRKNGRYGVFALSEDSNPYVNPNANKKSPKGKKIAMVSEGVKMGEVGPVVSDKAIELIKARSKTKTLAGGLIAIRRAKARATEKKTPTKAELKEGKEAIYEIEKRRRIQKEKEADKRKQARDEEEAAADVTIPPELRPLWQRQEAELKKQEKEAAENKEAEEKLKKRNAKLESDRQEAIERAEEETEDTMSLDELREREESLLSEDERIFEQEQTFLGERPERAPTMTGSFRSEPTTRMKQLLSRYSKAIARDPQLASEIVALYSKRRADIEKAVAILDAVTESNYDEARAARRGGMDAEGNASERLMMAQGAELTLRGYRMQTVVRKALSDMLANDPKTFEQNFHELLEEAAQYLKTRPDLPFARQDNIEDIDLAELYSTLTAVSAKNAKAPTRDTEFTPSELEDIAKLADLISEEFLVSPMEAAQMAQDAIYGEYMKRMKGARKTGYSQVSQILRLMNKARRATTERGGSDPYPTIGPPVRTLNPGRADQRTLPQEGGAIAQNAVEELLGRVEDGSLIADVKRQLEESIKKGETRAAEEAAIRNVIENYGFHNLGPKLLEGVQAQATTTGLTISTLQEKIDRIEALLKQPDFLRTNYNAPATAPTPAAQQVMPDTDGWVSLAAAEEYNAKYPEPEFDPQMRLDISKLMEMKGPRPEPTPEVKAPEEVTLIDKKGRTAAERALRAADVKSKRAQNKALRDAEKRKAAEAKAYGSIRGAAAVPKGVSMVDHNYAQVADSVFGGVTLPMGPGYSVFLEVKNAAKLAWESQPLRRKDGEAPVVELKEVPEEQQPQTVEEAEAQTRTTELEPDVGLDAAAAFDASMAINYAASVAQIKNPKAGKTGPLAYLRRIFFKEYGSVEGTRALVEEAVGFIQLWHERAMGHWAQAKAAMPGEWNRAKDDAVTHYLQGMSRSSVAKKTGYQINDEAAKYLDRLKADIEALGQKGVESGAFTKRNVVAGIMSGRAYLSTGLGQTSDTTKQVNSMLPELARLFEEAYPSLTLEQIEHASSSRLFNTIEHRLPNLQERLSTASYNGKPIGKREDKQYLVRQLKVDGLADPIPLAIVTENGSVVEILADKERLEDIVRSNIEHGTTPEQEVMRMVNSMLSENTMMQFSRGRGSAYGIQQTRRMLRSESELIRSAGKRLYRSTWGEGDKGKPLRKWLTENVTKSRSGTIEEFIEKVQAEFPETKDTISAIQAEYRLNKKVREALNELSDPSTLISKTVDSIAETVAMARFSTDLYRLLKSHNMASIGTDPAGAVDWDHLMPKGSSLGDSNFVALETKKGEANGPGVRKVHEMRVPKEVAKAVADMSGYGREIESLHGLFGFFRKVSSWTKYGKVVLNPLAHPRNAVSTGFIHMSRAAFGHNVGYANLVMLGMAKDQAKLAMGDLGRAWKEQKQSARGKRLEELMLENNLLFDGGKSGALYDLRKEGFGLRSNWTEKAHKGKKAWKNTRNFADTLFRLEDEAVKGAALITFASDWLQLSGNDVNLVKKYLETGKLKEEEQKIFDKAIKAAAEQVKNHYPTFSRTPEFIKMLSRNPILGAFPSFHSEMIRTTGHAIRDAMMLMGGKLPDGTAIAEGQRTRAFVLGTMRVSTIGALFSASAIVTQALYQMAFGDDEEDMPWYEMPFAYGSDAQRRARGLLPFWQRDAMTAVRNIDPDKKTFDTVAVSYLSPYGQINDVMNSMVHSWRDAAEAGVGSPEWAATKALLEGTINTFGNVEPLAGSLYKRWTRNPSKRESTNEVRNWANSVDKELTAYFNEYGNFIGGLVGGTIEAATPEAVGQAWAVGEKAVQAAKELKAAIESSAPEDRGALQDAQEIGFRLQGMIDAIMHIGGLKTRSQEFEADVIAGLAADKVAFSKANTSFKEDVTNPNGGEQYYEDFKEAAAQRHVAWMNIRDRFAATSDLLGADVGDVIIATIQQGDRFRTAGDNTLAEFSMDYYTVPSPSEYWSWLKESKTVTLDTAERYEAYKNYAGAWARYYQDKQATAATQAVPPSTSDTAPEMATPSDSLEAQVAEDLRSDEGMELAVYRDPVFPEDDTKWTVGIGHKLTSEERLKWRVGTQITKAEAEKLFQKDFANASKQAAKLPVDWDTQPPPVKRALINMVFQMGYTGVSNFKKTLRYLKAGMYEEAAQEALDSDWARNQTPRRAERVADMIRSAGK